MNMPYGNEQMLTYDDVLMVPQYSEIESRYDFSLDISTTLGKHSLPLPVISANMDTVTESSMAGAMSESGGMGIFHRFYDTDEKMFYDFGKMECCLRVGFSIGCNTTIDTIKRSIDTIKSAYTGEPDVYICMDVAHGDMKKIHNKIDEVRNAFHANDIIAGNVATPEGAIGLVNAGANIVKIGVGPGCFVAGTAVSTMNGPISIENVGIGDVVVTHTGEWREVTDIMQRETEELYSIEWGDSCSVECTGNHEIYVIHRDYIDKATENTYRHYAVWIKAEDLTDDYYVIEIVDEQ